MPGAREPGRRAFAPLSWLRRLGALGWWVIAPERIPERPRPEGEDADAALRTLRWLFSRESMPTARAESTEPRGTSSLRWLFGREALPEPPPRPAERDRVSTIAWLFGREVLPEPPPRPAERDGIGTIAWLFGSERLTGPEQSKRNRQDERNEI